ncbi:MAG: heavy-metal-associated domain-containing protein [Pseudomonadales bacterium]|nr:heavy-metal-associated domain-containing protein [Pseudomonadales bacterium]
MHLIRLCLITFPPLLSMTINAETIEVDIAGLTCPFCVHCLQRQLEKLPHISTVDISLKHRKVRIVSTDYKIDIKLIKNTVINAGFTPVKIRTMSDEQ